jgi:lipid A disaccharide synthetase
MSNTPFVLKYKRKFIFLIYWEFNISNSYYGLNTLDS